MVYGFLLPEVMREAQKRRVQLAQKKHLVAAHKTIHREGESMLKEVSREMSLESEKQSKDSSSQIDGNVEEEATASQDVTEPMPKQKSFISGSSQDSKNATPPPTAE